jgi:hypothetical protein
VDVRAELVIHGTAPPNQDLDLAGYRQRVGPGGRFILRVPVEDQRLIQAALAGLGRLPAADSEGGNEGGGP